MPVKRGERIGAYTVTRDFSISGQGEWGFASKGDNEYFIKRFLAPVCVGPGAEVSDAHRERSKQKCASFKTKQKAMIDALAACGDGGLVVKTKDLLLEGNDIAKNFYKVSEKVDTSSMSDKVHTLKPKERLFLMMTAAGGIKILHKNGIVHLDIKPDNVLIQSYNGRLVAKIIDFDSSILVDQEVTPEDVVGDYVYCAPEFANYVRTEGKTPPPSKPADVFSLGLIFCLYWWGKKPVIPDDCNYACEAVIKGKPLAPPYDRTKVSRSRLRVSKSLRKSGSSASTRPADPMEGGIIRLVEKMLLASPDKRPSMTEVHQTVSKLYHAR